MNKIDFSQAALDYDRIEKAIKFIEHNFHLQPSLKAIADQIDLSEHHFQRLFSRWVGISPKRFLQFLTKEYAKHLLENSRNILDVAHEAKLSGPGRPYDLFVSCETMTPGEYKNKGQGVLIAYGFHSSPFGECFLATTDRGICGLHFVKDGDRKQTFSAFKYGWKRSELIENQEASRTLAQRIFNPEPGEKPRSFHLILKGTNFQIKVWEALIKIPFGSVVAYEDVAVQIGHTKATRAVGTAIGNNPISFLIPCHRVIRKTGAFGNYGGGTARKKAILGWEAAQVHGNQMHQKT
jgi:AraC family transcriptional regulator of adaptative response/methylated-DNA-[protein]-cysteine methyltransferase